MCNLYSVTTARQAIIDFVKDITVDRRIGNLAPQTAVFPDYEAPVMRNFAGGRQLALLRWGFPPPPNAIARQVTNIRNVTSPFWRSWLNPEFRCVVPFTSFCEYEDTKPRKTPVWFAADTDRPLRFFAGLWRPWTGERAKVHGEHELFAFLTCPPNAEVGASHPKAMPVILTTPEEVETWLSAPSEEALTLQRPLPDGALAVVAKGAREDGALRPTADTYPPEPGRLI